MWESGVIHFIHFLLVFQKKILSYNQLEFVFYIILFVFLFHFWGNISTWIIFLARHIKINFKFCIFKISICPQISSLGVRDNKYGVPWFSLFHRELSFLSQNVSRFFSLCSRCSKISRTYLGLAFVCLSCLPPGGVFVSTQCFLFL